MIIKITWVIKMRPHPWLLSPRTSPLSALLWLESHPLIFLCEKEFLWCCLKVNGHFLHVNVWPSLTAVDPTIPVAQWFIFLSLNIEYYTKPTSRKLHAPKQLCLAWLTEGIGTWTVPEQMDPYKSSISVLVWLLSCLIGDWVLLFVVFLNTNIYSFDLVVCCGNKSLEEAQLMVTDKHSLIMTFSVFKNRTYKS